MFCTNQNFDKCRQLYTVVKALLSGVVVCYVCTYDVGVCFLLRAIVDMCACEQMVVLRASDREKEIGVKLKQLRLKACDIQKIIKACL